MVILGTLESSLDEAISCSSKLFILTLRKQNLEFINLKCVTYAQPIHLSLGHLGFLVPHRTPYFLFYH